MVITWGWMHKSSAACDNPEESDYFKSRGLNILLRKEKNIASGKCEAVNLIENSLNLEHELDQMKIQNIASLHRVMVGSSIRHICSKG